MTTSASTSPSPSSSPSPITHQLSLPLPRTADTSLHLHLTVASRHVLLFLTTTSTAPVFDAAAMLGIPGVNSGNMGGANGGGGGEDLVNPARRGDNAVPRGKVGVGSFVYAMPVLSNPKETLCTPLLTDLATLEATERIARILARRLQLPVYLGNSMSLESMGGGGSVEEEMAVVRDVVETVVKAVEGEKS